MEETRNRIGFTAKNMIALFSPILVNYNVLMLLFNEAVNSDLLSYILIIPVLILYILYRERRYIKAVILYGKTYTKLEIAAGVLLLSLSLMLKLSGSITFSSLEYNVLSIPIFLTGIILILFGYNTLRALSFPVSLLFLLIPPPILVVEKIGALLAMYGANLSYNLVKLVGLPVTLSMSYDIPIIFLTTNIGETVPFTIDIVCSGIYSLVGFFIFAIFISYISKGSLKNRVIVFLSSIPLLFLLNVMRITMLLILGYYLGTGIAVNIFHLLGGWTLVLMGSIIIFVTSEKFFNVTFYTKRNRVCDYADGVRCTDCDVVDTSPTPASSNSDLAVMGMILAISTLFTIIHVPLFTLSSATTNIQIDEPNSMILPVSFLPEVEGYQYKFLYRDTRFENVSKQDASLMYQYNPETQGEPYVYVGLEIAETRGACHPWEACLITYAGKNPVTQIDLRDITLSTDPPLSGRYFAYTEKGSTRIQVVLYWYTKAVFNTDDGYNEKWAKISIIGYAENQDHVPTVEARLLLFAEQIVDYWQPVSTWSSNILSVAKDGPAFFAILLAGLTTVISYAIYIGLRQKQGTRRIINRLDTLDKEIFHAVSRFDSPACIRMIHNKIHEETGEEMDLNLLEMKLKSAHRVGLIERVVKKVDNQPRFFWKTSIKP